MAMAGAPDRTFVKAGRRALKDGDIAAAERSFDQALAASPRDAEALAGLAVIRERTGDLEGALTLLRRARESSPRDGRLVQLIVANLDRQAEAWAEHLPTRSRHEALARIALRGGRADKAAQHLRAVVAEDPTPKNRLLLAGIEHAPLRGPLRRPSIWPPRAELFQDFEALVRRFVLADLESGLGLLTSRSRVVTMGSCFANRVAERLQARGLDVFYRRFQEDINTTYANLCMLDWIAGEKDANTAKLEDFFGAHERLAFEDHLRACELYIFSLGAAPCFFDPETGGFILALGGPGEGMALAGSADFRTTSVDENTGNLRRIIARVRALSPRAEIVLTVSPVALKGTYEFGSAVVADCISKSIMRLAVQPLVDEGAHYWPSFEIVRWLGGHVWREGLEPWSREDGNTRHVSLWLQDLIIRLFIEYFGDGSL